MQIEGIKRPKDHPGKTNRGFEELWSIYDAKLQKIYLDQYK